MKSSVTNLVTALGIPALAALGGAFAVFSAYDDAPGGVLLGFLLIISAVALSMRTVRRTIENPSEQRNHPRHAS